MSHIDELIEIREALFGVVAAITQTPSDRVKKVRLAANIAIAKITGVATTATVWGLVSTLGAAGTGTAIGSLSGAAATSATLAWIGGLVGGGMAAGALLLPAIGIAAGLTATMAVRRKVHRRTRKLEELHQFEDEILFSVDKLIRPLESISRDAPEGPTSSELSIYAHDGLKPLLAKINSHLDSSALGTRPVSVTIGFDQTLDPEYQKQLLEVCRVLTKYADEIERRKPKAGRQQKKPWLKRVWVRLRRKTIRRPAIPHASSVNVAVTFLRLLKEAHQHWDSEQELVLQALRRSTNELEAATTEELSDYIRGLSPAQLRGVVSNTKGIYHEMLFVNHHNSDDAEESAELMLDTNFPGADVQYCVDGHTISEVQLKAVSSPTLVYEHLQRYPDIELLATEEVAAVVDGIDSSGFSNAVLTQDVTKRLYELQDDGFVGEITDEILASAIIVSGVAVFLALNRDNATPVNFKPYLATTGIVVGTTSAIDAISSFLSN